MNITTNRNKKISIKAELRVIILLQILVSVFFLLYSVLMSAYQTYNNLSNRIFQSGEQLLTNLEDALTDLSDAALFPVSQETVNNDQTIVKALKGQCISGNFRLYSYFSQQARTYLVQNSVEMIALYDQDGHGVSVQSGLLSEYRICHVPEDAEWYQTAKTFYTGKPYLIPVSEVAGTGMPEVDRNYLCVCRGIMDIGTIQIVGFCMTGISTNSISRQFEALRFSPHQVFAVYKDDLLLFSSDPEAFDDFTVEKKAGAESELQSKVVRKTGRTFYLYNNLHHADGYSIVLRTPLSEAVGSIGGIQLTFSAIIALILIVLVSIIASIIQHVLEAMNRLVDACNHFGVEKLTEISVIEDHGFPTEINYLFHSFNHMSDRIRSLIGEVIAKQEKQQETELQLLRTQINPHYLYNTLEMIHMRAYMGKNYDVANMAELLGQNLQYGLRNTTKEVLLSEELEQVKIYLDILSYQYGNRIRTNIAIEDGLANCRIIKLIFQPIIENSVIHGISSADQILNIDIMGYRSGERIVFKISDDGAGMDEAQLSTLKESIKDTNSVSVGLRNVCRRILLNYGEEYTAEIDSKKNVGSIVTLYLPYRPDVEKNVSETD
ncbi:MAG: histidine kinase [Oscillospiraceae bacterium]|nr:histidine kinase [Oscillospiraceae bacterium]